MAAPDCPLTSLTSPHLIHNRPPYPPLQLSMSSPSPPLVGGHKVVVVVCVSVWGGCLRFFRVWMRYRDMIRQTLAWWLSGGYNWTCGPWRKCLAHNSQAHTHYIHNIQMPSSTPPACTSRPGVTLICQEAEGGQIYNDSREQHQVTTVNIYTGLTKDVAMVRGGSKHCRNDN